MRFYYSFFLIVCFCLCFTLELLANPLSTNGLQPFGGKISREMASKAATAIAFKSMLEDGGVELLNYPEVKKVFSNELGEVEEKDILALAAMSYQWDIVSIDVQGFPPNISAKVQIDAETNLSLVRKALGAISKDKEVLDLYVYAIKYFDLKLDRYFELCKNISEQQDDIALKESIDELSSSFQSIVSLNVLWEDVSSKQYVVTTLSQAIGMDEDNYLNYILLASILLKEGRESDALDIIEQGIAKNNEQPLAYFIKGNILLNRHLPTLAARAFSKAISISSENTKYLIARGLAYEMSKDYDNMCSDFYKACEKGDCSKFLDAEECK